MPIILDTRDPGFETAFAALLGAKRESAADVDAAVAAIIAVGVGDPARVPFVWSLPSRRIESDGTEPSTSIFLNSSSQMSTRLLSGIFISKGGYCGCTLPSRPGTLARTLPTPESRS